MRAKSANPKDCAAPFLSPAVVNLRWYYYIILHCDGAGHHRMKDEINTFRVCFINFKLNTTNIREAPFYLNLLPYSYS